MGQLRILPTINCPICGNASLAAYSLVFPYDPNMVLDLADEMTGLTIHCLYCKKQIEVEKITVSFRDAGDTIYS